jgi:hypothetical protein
MATAKSKAQRGRAKSACPVSREQILGKYWELANLDPDTTKGTIAGQLKALDSLCQELALEQAADDPNEPAQLSQQIYRSAWLLEPPGASPALATRRACTRTADDE